MTTMITRDNVEQLLDARRIEVSVGGGHWWVVRRNGATKLWKKSPERIRIPIKAGFRDTGVIDEGDFINGALMSDKWRVKGDDEIAPNYARIADHIDGYDRDDLGESPDF